jgi:CBS domain-containing protein
MKIRCAADIMTSPVILAQEEMRLTEVIGLLLRWNISGLPVVNDAGKLVGIITEHDVMNFAFDGQAAEATVGEAMSKDVMSFPPGVDIETLVNTYVSKRIRRVPIVEDGKVVGIVSRRDILREMQRMYDRF